MCCQQMKLYRLNLSGEKQIDANEKARLRMQRFRERKKLERRHEPERKLTRAEIKKKREYWKQKQHESRAKRRLQTSPASSEIQTPTSSECTTPLSSPPACVSKGMGKTALKSALARVKLPKNANNWVKVVSHIISAASPAKQKKLKEKGILCSPEKQQQYENLAQRILGECDSLKLKRDQESMNKRRLFAGVIHKEHVFKNKPIQESSAVDTALQDSIDLNDTGLSDEMDQELPSSVFEEDEESEIEFMYDTMSQRSLALQNWIYMYLQRKYMSQRGLHNLIYMYLQKQYL